MAFVRREPGLRQPVALEHPLHHLEAGEFRFLRAPQSLIAGAALVAFAGGQGIAHFHAGVETLRSKSLDRNSCDSGDRFNRRDRTFGDNVFGAGLPRREANGVR